MSIGPGAPKKSIADQALIERRQVLVCAQRLCEAQSREEWFAALQEVLANVVGAECWALFERRSDADEWQRVAYSGNDQPNAGRIVADDRFQAAAAGIAACSPKIPHLPCAFIPLKAAGEVKSVLVIVDWLPQQKPVLDIQESAVLQLLTRDAGTWLNEFALASPEV